jgi:sRNA-binding regulator protein Hfq
MERASVSGVVDVEPLELERETTREEGKMSGQVLPTIGEPGVGLTPARPVPRKTRFGAQSVPFRVPAMLYGEEETAQRQAELFYLQKQIQSQTPMVIVLEDGEQVEGCIEWYDRHTLKVRGRSRILIFKSAIKYMYKQGEIG